MRARHCERVARREVESTATGNTAGKAAAREDPSARKPAGMLRSGITPRPRVIGCTFVRGTVFVRLLPWGKRRSFFVILTGEHLLFRSAFRAAGHPAGKGNRVRIPSDPVTVSGKPRGKTIVPQCMRRTAQSDDTRARRPAERAKSDDECVRISINGLPETAREEEK